jgi:glycosyltransferase involved in cell wall biosynthesis
MEQHRLTDMRPIVDIAIPVHNEERTLDAGVRTLHAHLASEPAFRWHITIVNNASEDATSLVGRRLAHDLEGVRFLYIDEKGRGGALRTAWTVSDADVVAYTDVDLSTGLAALVPMIESIVTGEADIAIGSRLIPGADVKGSLGRECLSRGYNLLLHAALQTRFRDAQCGFKALRAQVARQLLPMVRDQGWFFDTELLVLAQRAGMRIREVPVAWIEDPDSRVDIPRTVMTDLRDVVRMRRAQPRSHRAPRGVIIPSPEHP